MAKNGQHHPTRHLPLFLRPLFGAKGSFTILRIVLLSGFRRLHLVAPATRRRRRYFSFLAQATPLPYRPHTSFRASPEHSRSVGSRTAQECGRQIVGIYTPRPFRLSLPRPSHRAQF